MATDEGTSLTSLLNPLTPLKLSLRALDDLSTLARVARREPYPVDALTDKLDSALRDLGELLAAVREVSGGARVLTDRVESLELVTRELIAGGRELTETAKELVVGGRDLDATARRLEGRTAELADGGRDLLESTDRLDAHAAELLAAIRPFTRHLPDLLGALGKVESLEESVETVAETMEPLQGAAEKVGRMTRRLGGGGSSNDE